jgi:hypothetical protein
MQYQVNTVCLTHRLLTRLTPPLSPLSLFLRLGGPAGVGLHAGFDHPRLGAHRDRRADGAAPALPPTPALSQRGGKVVVVVVVVVIRRRRRRSNDDHDRVVM